MHSQIYSGLSLISAISRNFRVAGENESIRARLVRPAGPNGFILARWANIVFFYPIGKKKVTLGPLFRSKNDKNRACITKNIFCHTSTFFAFF